MPSVLAAMMFLLAFFVLPGPISRLLGAKFAAMFLATTGVFVLPVILGVTWRGALVGGCDIAVLLGGAALARRFAFPQETCVFWARRIAAVISAGLFAFFSVLALMVASLAGRVIDTLPYDFLALVCGIVFAMLLSRCRERIPARYVAGSLVSASAQA